MALSIKHTLFLLPFLFSCQNEEDAAKWDQLLNSQRSDEDYEAVADVECDNQWNYTNVGAPFLNTWCTMCHHDALDSEDRQGATSDKNFNTHSLFEVDMNRVEYRVSAFSMPPSAEPPIEDIVLFLEWIECGAPE